MLDMSGEISVYELILELWKIENSIEELSKLPEDLEDKLREYFSQVKNYLRVSDRKTLSASLKEAELEATAKLVQSLFEVRLKKILKAVESGVYPETLYSFEKILYFSLYRLISDFKRNVEAIITTAMYSNWKVIETELDVVCFNQDIPQIVGEDLKMYGPFKKGDIAVLPKSNAQSLTVRGVANRILIMSPVVEKKTVRED
ncbi:MAG: hypothetical protein QXE67_01210 [Nitrososphaerota archaeon]